MTTVDAAIARSHEWRVPIHRTPAPGWRNEVTVQNWNPNTPRWSWPVAGPVDHCGLALNSVLHSIGLVMGRDFGETTWTPSGFAWMRNQGRDVPMHQIQPGDFTFFSNSGRINDITHVEIAISDFHNGGCWCIGWNISVDGQGWVIWRTPGYMVAAGRPRYGTTPPPPPPPTRNRARRALPAFV